MTNDTRYLRRGHDGDHPELEARWLLEEDYYALIRENVALRAACGELRKQRDAATAVVLLGVVAFVVALAVLVALP